MAVFVFNVVSELTELLSGINDGWFCCCSGAINEGEGKTRVGVNSDGFAVVMTDEASVENAGGIAEGFTKAELTESNAVVEIPG